MLATCTYNVFAMQYRFGGYDLSALIDSGWRIVQHQVPNHDFISVFPPSLYLLVAFAFRTLGVRWQALALVSSGFFLLITVLGLRLASLLRRSVGDRSAAIAALVYTLAQMIPLLVVGHPWHSAMAQSLSCYALLATFTLIRVGVETPSHRAELLAHVTAVLSVLLLSKPNLAGPTILVCFAAIAMSRLRWWVLLAAIASFIASSGILAVAHTNLLQTAKVYSGLTGRFFANYLFVDIIGDPSILGGLAWLLMFLPIAPLLYLFARTMWQCGLRTFLNPELILAFGGLLITLLGLSTDAELRIVETPAVLIGALLLLLARPTEQRRLQPPLLRAAIMLVVVATFLSAIRARMQMVGSWAEDSCGSRILLRDPFFGHFWSCGLFVQVLKESDAALASHSGARVFFGPRLEALYARDGLPSPQHLPVWWHPGTSYALPREKSVIHAWEADRFDLLIFGKNDRTRIPQEILDDIDKEFVIIPGTSATDIFVRRRP